MAFPPADCLGGPIVAASADRQAVTKTLLQEMKNVPAEAPFFIEFRNFFDCSELKDAFAASGFHFRPHLNYIVKIDGEAAGRLSSNRRRQIKTSLAAGAVVTEPESEADVVAFYQLLKKLYTEKVKKPLPSIDLFMQFWKWPSSKTFLVKYEGKVVGERGRFTATRCSINGTYAAITGSSRAYTQACWLPGRPSSTG